ncbi:MAG: hypothetical protein HY692_09715 [Cyanobacteria bacterium NC_groundwater_1444_Ag_S-0.65um_54_12]|nr:hypothetical protein [Cyanobacteria bacterium NC_groundwater_1444_Ag_S-0.65um_54_12]
MKRLAWLASVLLLLILTGCNSALNPVQPATPAVAGVRAELVLATTSYASVQTLRHRWQSSDIYHYEIELEQWHHDGYVSLNPPVRIILPQQGEVKMTAQLSNLKQGKKYRVTVRAWGNIGGTAAEKLLNSVTPSVAYFDLTGDQDLDSVHSQQVTIIFDPVLFSGKATVLVENSSPAVSYYDLRLQNEDTDETVFKTTYSSSQTMVLNNLKVGVPYRIFLAGKSAGGKNLLKGKSSIIYFDPTEQDIEQDSFVDIELKKYQAEEK